MALKLNEATLVQEVIEKIPYKDGEFFYLNFGIPTICHASKHFIFVDRGTFDLFVWMFVRKLKFSPHALTKRIFDEHFPAFSLKLLRKIFLFLRVLWKFPESAPRKRFKIEDSRMYPN